MKNNQQDKQEFKIREFDFFSVELKVRGLVQDLLQPYLKQQKEDKKLIESMELMVGKCDQKVDQIQDLVLKKDGKKLNIFEDVETKINLLEKKFSLKMQNCENLVKENQFQVEEFHKRLDESQKQFEYVRNYHQENERWRNLIEEQKRDYQVKMEQRISEMNRQFIETLNKQKQEVSNFKGQVNTFENLFKQKCIIIDQNVENKVQMDFKIQGIERKLDELEFYNKGCDSILEEINEKIEILKQKHFENVNNVDQIFKVENYVEKYSVMQNYSAISDILFEICSEKQKKILVKAEKKFFEQCNNCILSNNLVIRSDINKLIKESEQNMERIIHRNKHFLKNYDEDYGSIKKTSQNDIQINVSNSNQQIFQNPNQLGYSQNPTFIQGNQNIIQSFQTQESSKQVQKNSLQKIDNLIKIESNHQNFEKINLEEEGIQGGAFFIQLKEELNKIKQQNEKRQQDQKELIISFEENLLQLQLKYDDKFQKIEGFFDFYKRDLDLFDKRQSNQIIKVYDELEKIVGSFNQLSETVHKILHFITILNHLGIQDEIDKQGIALFGINETFKEMGSRNKSHLTNNNSIYNNNNAQKAAVSIDKTCLSCSGNSPIIQQTFKLACLAYQPSNIFIEGKVYKREELLELSTKILQQARNEYGIKGKNQNNNFYEQFQEIKTPNSDILQQQPIQQKNNFAFSKQTNENQNEDKTYPHSPNQNFTENINSITDRESRKSSNLFILPAKDNINKKKFYNLSVTPKRTNKINNSSTTNDNGSTLPLVDSKINSSQITYKNSRRIASKTQTNIKQILNQSNQQIKQ